MRGAPRHGDGDSDGGGAGVEVVVVRESFLHRTPSSVLSLHQETVHDLKLAEENGSRVPFRKTS